MMVSSDGIEGYRKAELRQTLRCRCCVAWYRGIVLCLKIVIALWMRYEGVKARSVSYFDEWRW